MFMQRKRDENIPEIPRNYWLGDFAYDPRKICMTCKTEEVKQVNPEVDPKWYRCRKCDEHYKFSEGSSWEDEDKDKCGDI